uniref:Putative secreted protein n=1 Tax=Anopheles darlingi TaxID=43151 RepID=A0A2M4DKR8_ANODA
MNIPCLLYSLIALHIVLCNCSQHTASFIHQSGLIRWLSLWLCGLVFAEVNKSIINQNRQTIDRHLEVFRNDIALVRVQQTLLEAVSTTDRTNNRSRTLSADRSLCQRARGHCCTNQLGRGYFIHLPHQEVNGYAPSRSFNQTASCYDR